MISGVKPWRKMTAATVVSKRGAGGRERGRERGVEG
jgi:hypothetical protein